MQDIPVVFSRAGRDFTLSIG